MTVGTSKYRFFYNYYYLKETREEIILIEKETESR